LNFFNERLMAQFKIVILLSLFNDSLDKNGSSSTKTYLKKTVIKYLYIYIRYLNIKLLVLIDTIFFIHLFFVCV